MNHYGENWVDPQDFRPERFLDGSKNADDRMEALQPFSTGPRNCIGRTYVSFPSCSSLALDSR